MHNLAPICDGDIRASTHVWASLWISIIAGLHMVIVFLVVHISGLYKNVLPAGSTGHICFQDLKLHTFCPWYYVQMGLTLYSTL